MSSHPPAETNPAPPAPATDAKQARRATDTQIARLAIPAFATLVSEPLFLLADAAIVGHLGVNQLAALGIAGIVIQTVIGIFIFLAYGTTATVARKLGAGDDRAALQTGVDGCWLALVIGGLAGAATLALAPQIVGAFGVSAAVEHDAIVYLRIAALGIPALLLTFAATGVVRGLQDTRTPLFVTITANLANIGLNLLFVYGFGWGIAGSASGTVVAQTLAAVVLATLVVRGARRYGASVGPERGGMSGSFAAGIPLIVRTITLRGALIMTTAVAASISTVAVAAHQVVFTIWGFAAFALDALAIAGQAITGRLLGAGDTRAVRSATNRMLLWGTVGGVVIGAALIALRNVIAPLFTSDPDVTKLIAGVLIIAAVQQPISGIVFVLDGILIGAGDGRYLAIAGVITLIVYTPLAIAVVTLGGGLGWLWVSFGGFMMARLITLVWRSRGERWMVTGAST